MNWIRAQEIWRDLGVDNSVEYMERHWEKIKNWKNRKPEFAARASRKEGGTNGDGKRPVVLFLAPDETDLQTNTNPQHRRCRRKDNHMKRSDAFPSKFLKAADLNGNDINVTIDSVEWEEVGKDKTQKPVIYFRGGRVKPMICNGTNWDQIVANTGEDDSDEWDGKKVTLYSTEVPFGREMVEAIRVRGPKGKTKAKAEPVEAADPEDD